LIIHAYRLHRAPQIRKAQDRLNFAHPLVMSSYQMSIGKIIRPLTVRQAIL
jgi:hypothetical protein